MMAAAQLTREQAAILGAFTGICLGPFEDIQAYAEKVLGRPCWTHEFADKGFWEQLKAAARPDAIALSPMRDELRDAGVT